MSFEAPKDNGTNYDYFVRAISNNGTHYDSEVVTATIKTGIEGYTYKISDLKEDTPNEGISTINTKIEIPKTISSKDYLHIRAFDKNGNTSETAHIPLKDIQVQQSITPITVNPFDRIFLEKQVEVYQTSINDTLMYTHYYGSENYRIEVQATPLMSNKGTEVKDVLKLHPIEKVIQKEPGLPEAEIQVVSKESFLLNETPQTILNAANNNGSGIGNFEVVFPENALELTADPSEFLLDRNEERTQFKSNITFSIIEGP